MQHLLDENAYKTVASCIDNNMQGNILRFLRQYEMCFTEPEWEFLNDKFYKVSNFYGLPKIPKSKITKSAINTQNIEIIEIFEPNDLKLRSIVGGPRRASKNKDD